MGTGWGTGVAECSRGNYNLNFVFVYIQEFGFHALFGAYQGKENHSEATKDKGTYFQEHNLSKATRLPHHAISIILIASKIAEAD